MKDVALTPVRRFVAPVLKAVLVQFVGFFEWMLGTSADVWRERLVKRFLSFRFSSLRYDHGGPRFGRAFRQIVRPRSFVI